MKYTNKENLPDVFLKFLENSPYSKGGADFSVTELIGPSWIRKLKLEHADELTEDVADNIWRILGSATHAIIEQANSAEHLQETRLHSEFNGVKVSGAFDLYGVEDGKIGDLKITSVWKIINGGDYLEWTAQLNCLAELVRRNGGHVNELYVIAIMRDWSARKALESTYPSKQVKRIKLDLWPSEKVVEYIASRVEAHNKPQLCTPEERWQSATTWAVKKEGRKSALRVLHTKLEAEEWLAMEQSKAGLSIEARPGEPRRCMDYCEVAKWCEFGKECVE